MYRLVLVLAARVHCLVHVDVAPRWSFRGTANLYRVDKAHTAKDHLLSKTAQAPLSSPQTFEKHLDHASLAQTRLSFHFQLESIYGIPSSTESFTYMNCHLYFLVTSQAVLPCGIDVFAPRTHTP